MQIGAAAYELQFRVVVVVVGRVDVSFSLLRKRRTKMVLMFIAASQTTPDSRCNAFICSFAIIQQGTDYKTGHVCLCQCLLLPHTLFSVIGITRAMLCQSCALQLEMHDEIFHFQIFKNFMDILKYFKTPSLKYFTKFLIFIIK